MHYFITTREDYNTSAIELAQVKRMQIFNSLNIPCKVIEIEKNDFSVESQNKLGTQGKVINIFRYFQNLPENMRIDTDAALDKILNKSGLIRKENNAYYNDKAVIQAHLYDGRLYYVDFLDQYGFTVKRQFFFNNHVDYTEYFDDQAHLMIREFVNNENNPVIRQYFCQSNQNKPMLTLTELRVGDDTLRFNKIAEFQGYFLDKIANEDKSAVFYCDRCTQVLPAFKHMEQIVPSYVVFHSALTPSGYLDDQVYTVYQPVTELTNNGKLQGVISSTKHEAQDAEQALKVKHSYAIPVTFIDNQNEIDFGARIPGKIIAVARVDAIKQLGHLIQAVIDLKNKYPELDLSIYGNNTDENENQKLQKLVSDNQAEDYIHFCGFAQDLDEVYNSAQLEVLTSKNEGFAMALLEAQAHGCPALSYDINYGPADIIADGVSGKLIKANDQIALRDAIAELISNPKLMAEYSQGAYQNSQKFDFNHLRNTWYNFLKEEKLV